MQCLMWILIKREIIEEKDWAVTDSLHNKTEIANDCDMQIASKETIDILMDDLFQFYEKLQ